MQTLVDAALEYLAAGFPIIALTGKKPNTAFHKTWSVDGAIRGTVETDEDRALVDRIFTHQATTGIGIPIPYPLVVVDIDGEEGARRFVELAGIAPADVPITPIAKTGRGLHLWFASVQPQRNTDLGSKLDIKGQGGYVAVPPSQHFDADTGEPDYLYQWLVPLVNEHGVAGAFDFLPSPIARLLTIAELDLDVETIRILDEEAGGSDWLPATIERIRAAALVSASLPWRGTTKKEGGTMDGLARSVKYAEEGNRNRALHWAASRAKEDGFSLEEAIATLVPASSVPQVEARRTVKSAFR